MSSSEWVTPAPIGDQIGDEDKQTLMEVLEQRLSKAQYESLVHCQNVLRESRERRQRPEFYEAPPRTAPTSSVASVAPSVVSAQPAIADWWSQSNAKNIARAEAEGMVRAEEPGYWLCTRCDREVAEHHLEAHMDSNKHQRYKQWYEQKVSLMERYERGELPDWMTVKDGEEYCKICDTRATEAHVYSVKHQKAMAWHESSGSTNQCVTSICDLSNMAAPTWSTPSSPTYAAPSIPFPIPANWGNPIFFEWRAEEGRYFCRLCWKYADDSHIFSEKHTTREQYPESYLGTDPSFANIAGTQPPPPPPKYPSPVVTVPTCGVCIPQVPAQQEASERLALCFPEQEVVQRQVACDPMPFMGEEHVNDTASSLPSKLPGGMGEESPRWERFAVDASQTSFWWWCEASGDSFVEDSPGAWIKYADPGSGKSYWWLDDARWFWIHSGSRSA